MANPLIMVAPNGARRTKADHPELPITLTETIATARACFDAGADALHLHVRDQHGQHSLDAGRYREALSELNRALPDIRVQITTEAVGLYDVPAQLACLKDVAPTWASISVREIAREPDLAATVYATCANQGCEVQHILYDTSDITLFNRWRADGTIRPDQNSILLVLGRYSDGVTSAPDSIRPLRQMLGDLSHWMVCAFGPQEHACLTTAAQDGSDVRVGFENSLVDETGTLHDSNVASVKRLKMRLIR